MRPGVESRLERGLGSRCSGRAATRRPGEYAGRGQAMTAKRLRHQPRVADAPQYGGWIAPQDASGSQHRHRSWMIIECRHIGSRGGVDGPRGARRGVRARRRAQIARQRQTTHRRVMVQIAERVDGRHREPCTRRRIGGGPSRDARDQDGAWLRDARRSSRRRHCRRLPRRRLLLDAQRRLAARGATRFL